MLLGTLYGQEIRSIEQAFISTGLYGGAGIILMALTRIIFDKISLPKISIRDEILAGNIAIAIIDAGNVIATAIILYGVMAWAEVNTLDSMKLVAIAYVVSQLLLTLASLLRIKLFAIRNAGKSLQEELHNHNIALALRFAGYRIGTAFAITAAYSMLVYALNDDLPSPTNDMGPHRRDHGSRTQRRRMGRQPTHLLPHGHQQRGRR